MPKKRSREPNRAVNHVRLMTLSVFSHILKVEPFRQIEVELNCGGLPLAADRILDLEVDFRPVECSAAFVDFVFKPAFFNRLDKRLLSLFPTGGIADRFCGFRRQIGFDFLELESLPDVETEVENFHDLAFNLFRRADDVCIVLRKAADAHESVEHSALLIAVDGSEFRPAAGQFAV